jgi:uncharacterized membrane protein YphA (DoxX/SURF4 family)
MIKRTTIVEVITVINIILFLYTGIAKIMDYSLFREQLAVSPILGPVAQPVALLLPWAEFAVVLMLVIPRWRLKGLYACLGLMTAFTLYIIAMFIFAKDMPCSCGGLIELLSWKQHLVFNAVFMLIDAWAIRLQRQEKRGLSNSWQEAAGTQLQHG